MSKKKTEKAPPEADEPQVDTGDMPLPDMDAEPEAGEMAMGPMPPSVERAGGMQAVLVEMRVPLSSERGFALEASAALEVPGFQVDSDFEPIPIQATEDGARSLAAASEELVLVRGTVDPSQIPDLEAQPNVEKVWLDTPIAPFGAMPMEMADTELMAPAEAFGNMPMEVVETAVVAPMEAFSTCPIGTCDCSPSTPRGNMADVANYLGVDDIWAGGHRGDGIVVGVVDGGITAQGRPISSDDTSDPAWPNKLIPRVIGGWPTSNWGTTGVDWGWHGNMTSTDVLGMAPNAQIYDLRIASTSMAGTISNALSAFQWAINQYAANGTPQILSNSWGIFQEAWDPTYARNANHPFTRKVIEAINAGILVLFAAGNCGGTCPDGRCGSDSGPGKSIWGANSHPAVITVGAVNKNEQFVGYSSQGPGALDPNKPDFCSITHFTGFFNSDSGTSAATPIAAGVLALMKQAKPSLTQAEAKAAFKNTAKDIGPAGFDQHSGSGILRAKQAFDAIQPHVWKGWENLGGFCTDGVAVSSWAANRLDCFVIGNNRSMYHKWWNGSAWHGWENLGGQCYSAPAAVSWGPNRIDTFVIGGNHAMYHKWWNGSAWKGWENLGGFCTDGVAVSSWAANRLDCFVVGNNRALYHKWWDGSSWHGWENLGGQCYSAPAAVSWGPNRIDVFVIGGNRAMYHKWWNGSAWHGWENLGGFCTDGVAVSSWAANRLDCFVVGNNRSMYHKWWNGSSWHGWENLGGQCYSAPAAVSWASSRIDTFVIGGNRAMYHKWYG